MSDVRRNYELAFHINPNLEESRIAMISSELKDQLANNGATVTFVKEPEHQHLSYQVAHNDHSYFGYIQFSTDGELELPEGKQGVLAVVEEYIKLNNDILRSLIIRLPSDAQKSQALERQMRAKERLEKRAQATSKAPAKSSADGEKLEKELETIIEKL
ncbi:MAG: 30S ribosomal protein S6 [Patescibacteria group bacterium]